MNLYDFEHVKTSKIMDDGVSEFCLCERVNEEYMRSLIKKYRNNNAAIKRRDRDLIVNIKDSILGVLKRWVVQ